jgi:hypothetical protein
MSFVTIASEKTVIFLWAQMKMHLRLRHETVRHFGRKERLGKVFVLYHTAHPLEASYKGG